MSAYIYKILNPDVKHTGKLVLSLCSSFQEGQGSHSGPSGLWSGRRVLLSTEKLTVGCSPDTGGGPIALQQIKQSSKPDDRYA